MAVILFVEIVFAACHNVLTFLVFAAPDVVNEIEGDLVLKVLPSLGTTWLCLFRVNLFVSTAIIKKLSLWWQFLFPTANVGRHAITVIGATDTPVAASTERV